jgi:hypothetical protein
MLLLDCGEGTDQQQFHRRDAATGAIGETEHMRLNLQHVSCTTARWWAAATT